MAPLQIDLTAKTRISEKSVPPALARALVHIFSRAGEGLWLVGGTALAGYYALHRRSDDLDLFAITPGDYRAGVLAVKSLQTIGARFINESSSPSYYHAEIELDGYAFTADVVLDEHMGKVGDASPAGDGVRVASIDTLLAMKIAALVSRCSEKDLFDLDFLLNRTGGWDVADFIERGHAIDSGLNAETLLISLQGTTLRREACSFLLPESPISEGQAFKKITARRQELIGRLLEGEKRSPPSEASAALAAAAKGQKAFRRRKG